VKKCITCQIELTTKYQTKFCGRSCAAKHNNVKYPKRASAPTKKCKNEECGEMVKISNSRSFCPLCVKNKKHLRGLDVGESTIEEMVTRLGSNRYDRIRAHTHVLHRKEKQTAVCENCRYDKHVELCHIVSISSFPKDTKVNIVNGRKNILFLCPNCHWEYDHGLLNLDQIKSGPGWIRTNNQGI